MHSSYFYPFTLIRVIDGDTFVGNIDLGFNIILFNQRIRLININCPELKNKHDIPSFSPTIGLNVKSFVSSLLLNKSLFIQSFNYDSFGRVLSTLYFSSDHSLINLNSLLLELEMATPF